MGNAEAEVDICIGVFLPPTVVISDDIISTNCTQAGTLCAIYNTSLTMSLVVDNITSGAQVLVNRMADLQDTLSQGFCFERTPFMLVAASGTYTPNLIIPWSNVSPAYNSSLPGVNDWDTCNTALGPSLAHAGVYEVDYAFTFEIFANASCTDPWVALTLTLTESVLNTNYFLANVDSECFVWDGTTHRRQTISGSIVANVATDNAQFEFYVSGPYGSPTIYYFFYETSVYWRKVYYDQND